MNNCFTYRHFMSCKKQTEGIAQSNLCEVNMMWKTSFDKMRWRCSYRVIHISYAAKVLFPESFVLKVIRAWVGLSLWPRQHTLIIHQILYNENKNEEWSYFAIFPPSLTPLRNHCINPYTYSDSANLSLSYCRPYCNSHTWLVWTDRVDYLWHAA